MPKIIVTSRYLKKGSKKNLKNYVKYIATREGAIPMVSERENYVGYLANRPGAVKFNTHGLFSQTNESINLEKVAKEIANHGGNVWTHVVSLRRDDAQKMGYDNLNAWRDLVLRRIPNIAKQSKIDMKNLRWYAAFHDKETNPHVHIIVYSENEREGFLTNHGIVTTDNAKAIYETIIDSPGSYLPYTIGYLEICRIRDTFQKAAGKYYSPLLFHTFLLDTGPTSFPVLERQINGWLKEKT